ncbi:HAD family hydrolase [Deinococcus petrolearius]|uniref:HAD family hydrolase n=1 Tax=Deinococcus petrolearius TaxID=1751295 RepID=A0ABW1DID8_9DEIO
MTGTSLPLRAVLFDRDDTLAWTDPSVYREAALWTAERFGLDARAVGGALRAQWEERASGWWHLRSEEDEAQFWTDYGLELVERMGLPPSAAPDLMAAFPYERYMKPAPGARAVLSELRARGLKIGVLSNTLPSIGRTLSAVGLDDLVDVALATCTLGVHKPEARAFLLAAGALGVAPGEVLFIDDRAENVEGARAVGMRAELIDLRGQTPGALPDLHAVLPLAAG